MILLSKQLIWSPEHHITSVLCQELNDSQEWNKQTAQKCYIKTHNPEDKTVYGVHHLITSLLDNSLWIQSCVVLSTLSFCWLHWELKVLSIL